MAPSSLTMSDLERSKSSHLDLECKGAELGIMYGYCNCTIRFDPEWP